MAYGPPESVEDAQEEQSNNPDTISNEQGEEQQQQGKKEQVKKILANVRQNFGKINVAPEFSEEDLVPVEMPDLDMSDISGSDGENSEEEEDEEEDGTNAELADGETEVSEPTTAQAGKANSNKSSREVIRELDEKIAKYKQFLDRAKSKHFSAIRSVCSRSDLTYIFSFPSWLSSSQVTWSCQAEMPCISGCVCYLPLSPWGLAVISFHKFLKLCHQSTKFKQEMYRYIGLNLITDHFSRSQQNKLLTFPANDFLFSFSLDRIPKALSDKAFTDIKTKQAAASAKQAQTKGSQSIPLLWLCMVLNVESISALVMV